MPRTRHLTIALPAILCALVLASCGGDDDEGSGGSGATQETTASDTATETTEATDTTDTSTSASGDPEDNPRAKELTSCLEDEGFTVFVNPGGAVEEADYQLVIDAGSGGVLYGFADDTAAKAAVPKVEREEGSAGREAEVRGNIVFAFFKEGQTLAAPEKYKKVRTCL